MGGVLYGAPAGAFCPGSRCIDGKIMSEHNIPAKPHRFVCNPLMRCYIREFMSRGGPCFVSIFVYFCLFPDPVPSRPFVPCAWPAPSFAALRRRLSPAGQARGGRPSVRLGSPPAGLPRRRQSSEEEPRARNSPSSFPCAHGRREEGPLAAGLAQFHALFLWRAAVLLLNFPLRRGEPAGGGENAATASGCLNSFTRGGRSAARSGVPPLPK